jgi:PAS domain S-box-containing protein
MSIDTGEQVELDASVLESVADGAVVLDDDGTVTYLDSTAVALFGAEVGQVVGQNIESILPADSRLRAILADSDDGANKTPFEDQIGTTQITGTVQPAGTKTAIFIHDHHDAETDSHETSTSGDREETERRDAVLEALHDVASSVHTTREEKIHKMLDIVAEYLDVSYGFVTRIEDGTQEILHSVGDHPDLAIGAIAPISETYCQYTLASDGKLAVSTASDEGWESRSAYDEFELECYLGIELAVESETYGTVCFADSEPRQGGFDETEETVVELLADWLTLMLERQTYERELEQQQAMTESLLDSLPDPVYAYDSDGTLLNWNDSFERFIEDTSTDSSAVGPTEFVADEDTHAIEEAFETALDGNRVSVEADIQRDDDTQVPFEFSGAPLYDQHGDVVGVTGVGRDITEQNTYRERLSRILETTRSLMQARDRQHVGELAANAAAELLDEDFSVFRLYDGDAGILEPIGMTANVGEALGERPTYDVGEGYPGEVFASGEPTIVSDFDDVETGFEYGAARSGMYYPVGVHGTITVASSESNAFDETDQQILALLATSAAGACMRAKRMEEIREAREHTERILDRVNGLVQNTIEVLVQARTRDELESGVVDELATTEPYSFAWLGQPDVATEQLVPTAWGGDATLPVEGRSFDLSLSNESVATAYNDGETQVITAVDDIYGPLAKMLDGSAVEALVVIPLVYKDATYGVLCVCANDGEIFDDRERVVLDALGRAVANAINAVERGRILDATEIIELEFAVDSPDLLFNRLSKGTESRIEAVGTDYRSDGSVRLYLSVENIDPDIFEERARQDSEVLEFTGIVDHDSECLVELVVEESLLAVLAEYGAVTREVFTENGITRFTVELPYEAEARELFELVEQRHPGTDLLGYHERERAVETRQDFKAALSERLTDRQETALRTAYLGGFFDWPREIDGNELAEAMDIARPTYHQHLRAAQAKVFEELFE